MASESGNIFSFHNVGLSSDHFVSKRLPAEFPLQAAEKTTVQTAFDKISRRAALKATLASKNFFDPHKADFRQSTGKLSLLRNKIATTDRLIRLIVYRLLRINRTGT